MKHWKDSDHGEEWRFGIVVATFNRGVTRRLLAACLDELTNQGVAAGAIQVVRVPGAFELPLVARTLAQSKRFDAVICLGAVIRGETPHFEYISAETSRGISQASLDTGVPIIFGVLTTDTVAQARERADPERFNRGGAAAQAAIDMARVMRMVRGGVGKLKSQESASQTGRARGRKRR
jgi:6,7-dimethyl-8-ribityllumazine synthase